MKKFVCNYYEKPLIKSIIIKDKYFCVPLRNDIFIRISAKKKLDFFLNALNTEINNYIFFSNSVLCDLYRHNRKAFFYADLHFKNNFADCEHYISKSLINCNTANKLYFVFPNLEKLTKEIIFISDQLIKVYKKNNFWYDVRSLEQIKILLSNKFKTMIQNIKSFNEYTPPAPFL